MKDFQFWIVKGGKLVPYRRLGECNRCGDCCQVQIHVRARAWTESEKSRSLPEGVEDWADWEGWSVFRSQGLVWAMWYRKGRAKSNCEALKDGNRCKFHGRAEMRALCRYWPLNPRHLMWFPNCSYKIEKAPA